MPGRLPHIVIEIRHTYPDGVPGDDSDLSRVEEFMSKFAAKLDALEQSVREWNAQEIEEDKEYALSKAEVTRLTTELADLQARYDQDVLTPEEESRFDALKAQIDASKNIPSDVLPEPEPNPEPPQTI